MGAGSDDEVMNDASEDEGDQDVDDLFDQIE